MKLLGLNSPEIFIILVVLLSIIGTKRIEKGFSLIKKLLKFLLSDEENHTLENTKVKVSKPEEIEVKEEPIEAEVKVSEPEEIELKEESIEAEVKSIKPKKRAAKDEILDVEVNSDNKWDLY